MPYIDKVRRLILDSGASPETSGELNYAMTSKALAYVDRQAAVNYTVLNTVLGAFDAAKAEFYRRMVAPYERKKCEENGDVYPEVR